MQIDSKLKFHVHTNTVTKKLTVFWALSVNIFSVKILILLLDYIQLLVRPIIEYDIVLWGPTYCDSLKVEQTVFVECSVCTLSCCVLERRNTSTASTAVTH